MDMTTEDIIIKFLKEGMTQPEIADMLKCNGIKPNSLRSVEGIINELKKQHNCTTMFQLGYFLCKKDCVDLLNK